jgi:transposase
MSIEVCLPRAQRRRLQRHWRKTPSRVEAVRARVLLLLEEGYSAADTAHMVGCVRATVYRTVYRFEELGEEALCDRRSQREPLKVTAQVEHTLLGYLDAVPKDYGWTRVGWTLELLARQLQADVGIGLSPSYIYRLLRGWGCRRGRARPGLRIPVRGRRRVLDAIARLVARACAEEEVFYQDEADIHLNPKIGATYLKRGQQSLVLTPGKNVKRYVFGALNVRSGRIVHGIALKKNSATFVQFLDYLGRTYRRARRIHVVLDNYSIHKARAVMCHLRALAGRIVLHFLPPYSPDDNPIERLWKQMHDHVTRNHRHRTIETLVEDVRAFLDNAQPFPGTKVSTLRAAA